jgi:hypothetical protein
MTPEQEKQYAEVFEKVQQKIMETPWMPPLPKYPPPGGWIQFVNPPEPPKEEGSLCE